MSESYEQERQDAEDAQRDMAADLQRADEDSDYGAMWTPADEERYQRNLAAAKAAVRREWEAADRRIERDWARGRRESAEACKRYGMKMPTGW